MTGDGPLAGIRVVELSRYIAAPATGKMLGEMGADVIKVEDPRGGDPMRRWQSGDRPHSPQFAIYNRTKRGLSLDLKHPRGQAVFLRLADGADVVVENFRPGVMDRLGLGSATLRARNTRLVYCSISGFGDTGDHVDRPAYDTVISAVSGLYSQILDTEAPRPVGPAFSDLIAGSTACQGILAALVARQNTGRGQHVDASMLRSMVGFLAEPASVFLDQGAETYADTRQRRAQSYGLVSSDRLPFVIHMSVPEKFWLAVTEVMGLVALRSDPRFAERDARHDNYVELDGLLKEAARARTRAEWFEALTAADVPHGPINDFPSLFNDTRVFPLDLVEEVDLGDGERPLRQVGPALRMSDTPLTVSPAAPALGQHNTEIRAELGMSGSEIDDLRHEGVIGS